MTFISQIPEAIRRAVKGQPQRVRKQLHVKLDVHPNGRPVACFSCLTAAAQVKDVDEPFETPLGNFDHPPFHINCRCIPKPWQKGYATETQREAKRLIGKMTPSQKKVYPRKEGDASGSGIVSGGDPEKKAAALARLRFGQKLGDDKNSRATVEVVRDARENGASWKEIGEALGESGRTSNARYRGKMGKVEPPKPRIEEPPKLARDRQTVLDELGRHYLNHDQGTIDLVKEARSVGATWKQVGEALGVSGRTAHHNYAHLMPEAEGKLPKTTSVTKRVEALKADWPSVDSITLRGLTKTQQGDIMSSLESLHSTYPDFALRSVKVGAVPRAWKGRAYAVTSYHDIILNREFFSSAAQMEIKVAMDEASHFHPKTPDTVSAEQAVLTHEFGHVIHNNVYMALKVFGAPPDSALARALQDVPDPTVVSTYAGENLAELVAEAFTSYELGNPTREAVKIVEAVMEDSMAAGGDPL